MSRQEDEMAHISGELLERYTLQQLSEEKLAPIEEHLLVCQRCQQNLTEVENFVDAMKIAARQMQEQKAPAPAPRLRLAPRRPLQWALPLAGGLLVSTLLIFSYARRPQDMAQSEVILTATRGASEAAVAQAPANSILIVQTDAQDVAPGTQLRLEVANSDGRVVWQGAGDCRAGRITARVNHALSSGSYWFRVYERGDLVKEYALQLK